MDAKNQNLANRSKQKMQLALHAEKFQQKKGDGESHFFHTHKIATEPVSFGPKPEIPEPTMVETLSSYASEAVVVGKVLLEEGVTLVKKAEGPARKLAAAAKKFIAKPRKAAKAKRKRSPVKRSKTRSAAKRKAPASKRALKA